MSEEPTPGPPVLRRALVIGINQYDTRQPVDDLTGAVNDADEIAELLRTHEDRTPNWAVTCVTDEDSSQVQDSEQSKVTVDRAKGAIRRLFRPLPGDLRRDAETLGIDLLQGDSGASDAASAVAAPAVTELLLYFAGHAVRSGSDGIIRLYGYDGPIYSFEELLSLIRRANTWEGVLVRSMTIILDCCMSGGVGKMGRDPYGIELTLLPDNVFIATATRPDEDATEKNRRGVFTGTVIAGLGGASANIRGAITALGLFAYASEAMPEQEQRPMLKTNVDDPALIRQVQPKVTDRSLLELPRIFHPELDPATGGWKPQTSVKLTKAHDGVKGAPRRANRKTPWVPFVTGTAKQTELDHLKVYRNAGMVETITPGRDFWDLCVAPRRGEDRGVRLTPLGVLYWRIAHSGVFGDWRTSQRQRTR